MSPQDRNLYLLALSLIKGLGPVSVKSLIAYCGSAEAVFQMPVQKLTRAPGIGVQAAKLVREGKMLDRAELEMRYAEKHGLQVLNYLDEAYPHALKFIHDAPLILFQKGPINLNAQLNLAIVGTRRATPYGRELAEQFATCFAQAGLNVVSGLAYGIDIAAHRSVLQAGGKTTAVLAHGLDTLYPGAHRQRAEEMLERGGWITEYPTGTKPDAPHFPSRNRIIAGMCKAVVVIEAAARGGALITARQAFEQNREVYAIPGRVGDTFSEGCNRLIQTDVAKLIQEPQEVLADLEIQWQQHDEQSEQLQLLLDQAPTVALSPDEAKVLNFLARGDALVDQITLHTGIPMAVLNPLLLQMEFKSLLKQLPGKRVRRV